ncbi:Wzz/FepE/Etk N-terminal domain-containing protein [Candidatus Uhrbacteria bacterium]|nr:Wzz/FepE/Etk N-terminal domain-containing protein [Candidatus Uhrbacteria bacterium]
MSSPNLVRLFVRSWRFVTLVTLLGLVLALGFSLIQPLKYSSSVRLLITHTNVTGLDPYTAVKSTERIAQNLSEIIFTSSFFGAVMAGGDIDTTYFSADEITKRREWRDTIGTSVSPGTGLMTVTAYHPKRDQATALAVRVARELSAQAPDFFGYSVRVQIIDDPLPSRFFAKPDFVRNALLGAIFGGLLASAWVLGRRKTVA